MPLNKVYCPRRRRNWHQVGAAEIGRKVSNIDLFQKNHFLRLLFAIALIMPHDDFKVWKRHGNDSHLLIFKWGGAQTICGEMKEFTPKSSSIRNCRSSLKTPRAGSSCAGTLAKRNDHLTAFCTIASVTCRANTYTCNSNLHRIAWVPPLWLWLKSHVQFWRSIWPSWGRNICHDVSCKGPDPHRAPQTDSLRSLLTRDSLRAPHSTSPQTTFLWEGCHWTALPYNIDHLPRQAPGFGDNPLGSGGLGFRAGLGDHSLGVCHGKSQAPATKSGSWTSPSFSK